MVRSVLLNVQGPSEQVKSVQLYCDFNESQTLKFFTFIDLTVLIVWWCNHCFKETLLLLVRVEQRHVINVRLMRKRGSSLVNALTSGARATWFDPTTDEGNFGVRTCFLHFIWRDDMSTVHCPSARNAN